MKKTQRVYIFGCGDIGYNIVATNNNDNKYNILGFLDNNSKLWNKKSPSGLNIYAPEKVIEGNYDAILVASGIGFEEIPKQLMKMGVSRDKIITDYALIPLKARIVFLEKLGVEFHENKIKGSVAEGGVYHGNFSCEINRVFSDKKLYLFDTFKGYDERDMKIEDINSFSDSREQNHFMDANEELVIKKMPYPENIIIKKGYFPETTKGLDETFCFVNLDFDLYHPILAGLEYFFPRMVSGGIILVHDYFSDIYIGVKAAVREFAQKNTGIKLFPIGDGLSIGICC